MKHTIGQASIAVALIIALLLTHEVAHAAPLPQSSGSSYTIRKGDTLSEIANNNSISVPELMRANGLTNSIIYPGQVLHVPDAGQSTGTSRGSRGDSRSLVSGSSGFHTVQAGESVSHIAATYGISRQGLLEANGLSAERIYVGQTLVLPSSGRQSFLPLSASGTVASSRTSGCSSSYHVQRGDRLRDIADDCGTTVDAIMTANSLRQGSLYRGQVLVIPGSE